MDIKTGSKQMSQETFHRPREILFVVNININELVADTTLSRCGGT